MKPASVKIAVLVVGVGLALPGCSMWGSGEPFTGAMDHYDSVATEIEFADVEAPANYEAASSADPMMVSGDAPKDYWDLSLEEAIRIALTNSKVLRDLGGSVLTTPDVSVTPADPAIAETDPRFGVEAALSAFDAQYTSRVFFDKNDQPLNNILLGGGTRLLRQDLIDYEQQLSKRTASGSEFIFRQNVDYDANNAPGNLFPSAWDANFEVEARQPLLQGAGAEFNRIAGPDSIPGFYNGVLVARVNTDIEIADFQVGVRDLVSNVENAYWDLYFAYRDLHAKIAARDASLDTWRRVHALFEANREGGEAEKEAQAREQYFRFEEEVQNALAGRLFDGTRTNNGSRGGTFRGTGGVYVTERRLRLLMGVPSSDGRLVRPSDEPTVAPITFDWREVSSEAIARRAELRRQRWQVKRQELELAASRNYLLPQLDTVAQYRWRGFGHDLIDPNGTSGGRFDNAFRTLTTGDFQEWQLGVELSVPIGYREGHTAVRNAELRLARQRAILREQEHQVVHDAADAVAEVDRAFTVLQTSYNRRVAAEEQLAAVSAAYESNQAPLDQLLDSQRRLADSESRYYRQLVEFELAIKNVHFEKGSLLEHNSVLLSEGPWPGAAYENAQRRARTRITTDLDYRLHPSAIVTAGGGGGGPVMNALPPNNYEMETIEGEAVEAVPVPGTDLDKLPQAPNWPLENPMRTTPDNPFRDDPNSTSASAVNESFAAPAKSPAATGDWSTKVPAAPMPAWLDSSTVAPASAAGPSDAGPEAQMDFELELEMSNPETPEFNAAKRLRR